MDERAGSRHTEADFQVPHRRTRAVKERLGGAGRAQHAQIEGGEVELNGAPRVEEPRELLHVKERRLEISDLDAPHCAERRRDRGRLPRGAVEEGDVAQEQRVELRRALREEERELVETVEPDCDELEPPEGGERDEGCGGADAVGWGGWGLALDVEPLEVREGEGAQPFVDAWGETGAEAAHEGEEVRGCLDEGAEFLARLQVHERRGVEEMALRGYGRRGADKGISFEVWNGILQEIGDVVAEFLYLEDSGGHCGAEWE
ncbi:hypothetical protein C8R43DRAFT_639733 [Mycena crocata]|nr:hypothetical protein C8R43DRAFT_639733 [Mycena crocata]